MTKDNNVLFHRLSLIRTGSTSLPLAILALKDVIMWPVMTYAAKPLNERRLRFQDVETVVAVTQCHWQAG